MITRLEHMLTKYSDSLSRRFSATITVATAIKNHNQYQHRITSREVCFHVAFIIAHEQTL
ncbi:hypothetical protein EVA_07788 [gut metagenome]|uniref:Uncharacterized protein n=1 Tax=gut metagenome TaxID=749906 RepID=J9CV64_9ZZZZ